MIFFCRIKLITVSGVSHPTDLTVAISTRVFSENGVGKCFASLLHVSSFCRNYAITSGRVATLRCTILFRSLFLSSFVSSCLSSLVRCVFRRRYTWAATTDYFRVIYAFRARVDGISPLPRDRFASSFCASRIIGSRFSR